MTTTTTIEEGQARTVSTGKGASLAKIMVATDFSPVSKRALDYAVALARRFGSELYLTHVLLYTKYPVTDPGPFPTPAELREGAKKRIQDIIDSGSLYGVRYQVVVEEGDLWPMLEMMLAKHGIDLLVVGTHGMNAGMKAIFGSSAEEAFRRARVPVLTVGPAITAEAPFEVELRNILFATAFGPAAEREAELAFALAREHRSRLLMMHVTVRPDGFSEFDAEAERKAITKKLEELVPAGATAQCKPEFCVAYGNPVEEILRDAHQVKADLIVIGAKKGGALAGHNLHSKAFAVVRGAGCPVLTVKS